MHPMSRAASIPICYRIIRNVRRKECQEKGVLAACPIPSSLDLTDLTLGMGIPSNVQ